MATINFGKEEEKKYKRSGNSIVMKFQPKKTQTRKTSTSQKQRSFDKNDFAQTLRDNSMRSAPRATQQKFLSTDATKEQTRVAKIFDQRENNRFDSARNQQMRLMQQTQMNNDTRMTINKNRMENNLAVQGKRNAGALNVSQQDNNYANIRQQSSLMGRSNVAGANNLAKYQTTLQSNLAKNGAESVLAPMLGQDVYDNLASGEEAKVLQYMSATGGQMPPMKKLTEEGTFWDTTSWMVDVPNKKTGSLVNTQKAEVSQQQQPEQQGNPVIQQLLEENAQFQIQLDQASAEFEMISKPVQSKPTSGADNARGWKGAVGRTLETVGIPYPQKGLSPAELIEYTKLTPAEKREYNSRHGL